MKDRLVVGSDGWKEKVREYATTDVDTLNIPDAAKKSLAREGKCAGSYLEELRANIRKRINDNEGQELPDGTVDENVRGGPDAAQFTSEIDAYLHESGIVKEKKTRTKAAAPKARGWLDALKQDAQEMTLEDLEGVAEKVDEVVKKEKERRQDSFLLEWKQIQEEAKKKAEFLGVDLEGR